MATMLSMSPCVNSNDRMTRICVSILTTIGSDNGLSPRRCLTIIHYLNQCWNIVNWTHGNKLQWNLIAIQTFSFRKMYLQMSSAKWRPFCLSLDVLRQRTLSCRCVIVATLCPCRQGPCPGHQRQTFHLPPCVCDTQKRRRFHAAHHFTKHFPVTANLWWRHQMGQFSALLDLCAGNSPVRWIVPVNSPHNGQWRGALVFSLNCARINGWVNNGEAGDLRRYDVIAMWSEIMT